MARAAAMQVAGTPGRLYNPLFIYGGVGLGKTHLMHAVGNELLADRPDAQRPLHPCRAVRLRRGARPTSTRPSTNSRRYYHSLDLLLIDDIQFFAGKEPHAGRVLLRVRGAAGQASAHHHDLRHLSQGTGGHRGAADLALRRRA